jgi:phenylalanyl-tRNA synthetase beta subunit
LLVQVLQLSDNPFKDKKLPKVLKEGKLKPILVYIAKNGAPASAEEAAAEAAAAAAAVAAVKLQAPQRSFEVAAVDKGHPLDVNIDPSVKAVRPHLVCAAIHGLSFTPGLFQRFISLQTDLHSSMCAKRSLAAIGTHNLAAVKFPLTYEALPPGDISFVPLVREGEAAAASSSSDAAAGSGGAGGAAISAADLGRHFASDATMLRYLSYISSTPSSEAPLYAVLKDAAGSVLSVPPVINAHDCRVAADTQDVLLEVSSSKSLELAQDVALAFLEQLGKAVAVEATAAGGGEGGSSMMQVTPVRLVTPGTGHVRLVFPRPA